MHFDDCVYSYLDTCHCVIRGIGDQNCSKAWSNTDEKGLNRGCPILNNALIFLKNYGKYKKIFQTKVV